MKRYQKPNADVILFRLLEQITELDDGLVGNGIPTSQNPDPTWGGDDL